MAVGGVEAVRAGTRRAVGDEVAQQGTRRQRRAHHNHQAQRFAVEVHGFGEDAAHHDQPQALALAPLVQPGDEVLPLLRGHVRGLATNALGAGELCGHRSQVVERRKGHHGVARRCSRHGADGGDQSRQRAVAVAEVGGNVRHGEHAEAFGFAAAVRGQRRRVGVEAVRTLEHRRGREGAGLPHGAVEGRQRAANVSARRRAGEFHAKAPPAAARQIMECALALLRIGLRPNRGTAEPERLPIRLRGGRVRLQVHRLGGERGDKPVHRPAKRLRLGDHLRRFAGVPAHRGQGAIHGTKPLRGVGR